MLTIIPLSLTSSSVADNTFPVHHQCRSSPHDRDISSPGSNQTQAMHMEYSKTPHERFHRNVPS